MDHLLLRNTDSFCTIIDITDCVSLSPDIPKNAMLKAIFMVKRLLSNGEINLDALWHQCICTSLLLSVNVRGQSLHLAVHCKPDCPSHCPVPLSPHCNPKTCTGQQTCLLSSTPTPVSALSYVLWALKAL